MVMQKLPEYKWSKFIDFRQIDKDLKKVVVDICGYIVKNDPTDEELKKLKSYPGRSWITIKNLSEKEKREYLLELLRYFYDKEEKSPKIEYFTNNPKYPSYSVYQNVFGSWSNALIEAGLSIDFGKNKNLYMDEELLKCLIQFFEENGRPPVAREFRNNPKYPSISTYIKHFGNWQKALKLVGLDTDSMVIKGFINTDNQKARLAEILVKEHFVEKDKVIDLSGVNYISPYDGICPKNQTYDVKSSKMLKDYWVFSLANVNKDEIEWYYLLAFNEDYTKLMYAWRIDAWEFIKCIENGNICIGIGINYENNIENIKKYEISGKIKPIFENWLNNIKVWPKEEILANSSTMLQQYVKNKNNQLIS